MRDTSESAFLRVNMRDSVQDSDGLLSSLRRTDRLTLSLMSASPTSLQSSSSLTALHILPCC